MNLSLSSGRNLRKCLTRIYTRKLGTETKPRETLFRTSAVFDSSSDAANARDEKSLLGYKKEEAFLPGSRTQGKNILEVEFSNWRTRACVEVISHSCNSSESGRLSVTRVTGQCRPRRRAGTQLQKRFTGEETQTSLLSREEDRRTSVLFCRKFILHPV